MKKNMKKAIMMAMVLALALAPAAQADTIFSPTFRFYGVEEQPTEVPTAEPTVEPTEAPTAEPTAAPAETAAEEPTAEPTAEPTEAPTAEPLPEITLKVSSNLAGLTEVDEGTLMILTLTVEGADNCEYTIRWQETKDGVTWVDIPGANGMEYALTLKPEHSGMYWRACLDIADTEAAE